MLLFHPYSSRHCILHLPSTCALLYTIIYHGLIYTSCSCESAHSRPIELTHITHRRTRPSTWVLQAAVESWHAHFVCHRRFLREGQRAGVLERYLSVFSAEKGKSAVAWCRLTLCHTILLARHLLLPLEINFMTRRFLSFLLSHLNDHPPLPRDSSVACLPRRHTACTHNTPVSIASTCTPADCNEGREAAKQGDSKSYLAATK